MPSAGFEPAILASGWTQTHALVRAVTGIGQMLQYGSKFFLLHNLYTPKDIQDLMLYAFFWVRPMKMEQTECSEMMVYKIQTPGNYPEESIKRSEHGESLKSRTIFCFLIKLFHSIGCLQPFLIYESVELGAFSRLVTYVIRSTHYKYLQHTY